MKYPIVKSESESRNKSKMKVLQLLLCLLSSLGSALVFTPPVKDHTGDTVLDPRFESKLRSLINVSMECHHIPGMTLAVVKGEYISSKTLSPISKQKSK